MRHYESDMLRKLSENNETVRVGAATVLVKPSPSEPRPGYVDRMLWEQIKNIPWELVVEEEKNRTKDIAKAVQKMRDTSGGFNENINSVEIHTKYEELNADGNTVGLWRYYPRQSQNRKDRSALVFIHGGGWISGSVYTVENSCRYIAEKADAVVFSVDYSLAPEKPYPNGLNDCYCALCHVAEHAAEYGIDPNRIAICGDSAGGNLTAALALMARDKGFPKVALQVLIYPVVMFGDKLPEDYAWSVDLLGIAPEQEKQVTPLAQLGRPDPVEQDFMFIVYHGESGVPEDPYMSPAFAKSHEGLPPALLISGEFDGLRLHTEYYAGLLTKAGVPNKCIRYRGLSHAFVDFIGILPQAEDLCNEIADAVLKM